MIPTASINPGALLNNTLTAKVTALPVSGESNSRQKRGSVNYERFMKTIRTELNEFTYKPLVVSELLKSCSMDGSFFKLLVNKKFIEVHGTSTRNREYRLTTLAGHLTQERIKRLYTEMLEERYIRLGYSGGSGCKKKGDIIAEQPAANVEPFVTNTHLPEIRQKLGLESKPTPEEFELALGIQDTKDQLDKLRDIVVTEQTTSSNYARTDWSSFTVPTTTTELAPADPNMGSYVKFVPNGPTPNGMNMGTVEPQADVELLKSVDLDWTIDGQSCGITIKVTGPEGSDYQTILQKGLTLLGI
ncbi:hypothetical protein CLV58_109210 [Spirosoma oryzae]|uniref:Uncharacterized protein n=1 Tax=Spirosoma oryzae TaxID=1469603 RepID=A0A2T0SYP6_9BACT|nr:hypothetical protein [Spirosoma oryzae]PRY38483.1 hypothetical protein CLV58_109210 [Spirosoma oryzae]